jgi:hypothetical protein
VTVVPAERRRRRRRRRWPRVLLLSFLVAAVFALGVAFGQALHDNPKPGGTQTLVRTLKPLPLVPVPATTHTGTGSNP